MNTKERRLDRLEENSTWGSRAEIAAADVLVMRIPEGAEADPRVVSAKAEAEQRGKSFCATSSSAAADMPLWSLVPIDRIPDALLDDRIAYLTAKLTAEIGDNELEPTTAIDIRLRKLLDNLHIPKAVA